MYLIKCRSCRLEFANEARICPRCGDLRNHVQAAPDGDWARIWPNTETGESRWTRRGQ